MKKTLIVTFLLLMISISLSAQERLTPEEMFRWFPEGKYDGAAYKDNLAAQTMPGFQILNSNQFGKRWTDSVLLPETLKEHWLSLTGMKSVKIVVSISEKQPKFGRGGGMTMTTIGDKKYVTNSFGYRLQVIRFSPETNLTKKSLALEGVSKTEFNFDHHPVYFVKARKSVGGSEDFYFCITPENEVLACVEIKLLEKMIKTGSGELPCVIDNFPFPLLLEMLPDLHQSWSLHDWSANRKALVKKLEKDEVDNSEIGKQIEFGKRNPLNITDYSFEKVPVMQRILVFADSEYAESNYQATKKFWGDRSNPNVYMSEAGWFQQESTKLSLDKTRVYQTLVFSDDYVEKYAKLLKASSKETEASIRAKLKKRLGEAK